MRTRGFFSIAILGVFLIAIVVVAILTEQRNKASALFVPIYSPAAKIKFGLTSLVEAYEENQTIEVNLAGETHIQTHQSHPDFSILQGYLGEDLVALARTGDYESLVKLASAVSKMLPEESVKPRIPEPHSALELLGVADGIPYPKLCSKDAKIYVQILNSVGLSARIIEVQNHVLSEVFLPTEQTWAAIDPYWGCGLQKNSKPISAAEANKLLTTTDGSKPFDYCWEHDRFRTVVVNPVNRLIEGEVSRWNYWNYDNLDYWIVKAVSPDSPQLWIDRNKPSD